LLQLLRHGNSKERKRYAALTNIEILVHGQASDHYLFIFVVSVCLSVCLFVCAVFLSRLWFDFDQTWTYVICMGL